MIYFCGMETIIINPTSKIKLQALKSFLEALEIQFEVKKVQKNQIVSDLTEAFNDVKLYEQGKIKLKSAKELLNEL